MTNFFIMAGVFLATFIIGYLLISRIPPRLHTPLMSMTNAVSAVTILGGLLLFTVEITVWQKVLGFLAISLAAFNVVGGFTITDRMLRMFHRHHG